MKVPIPIANLNRVAIEMQSVAAGAAKPKMTDAEVAQAFLDLHQRMLTLERVCTELIRDVHKLKNPTIQRVGPGAINGRNH